MAIPTASLTAARTSEPLMPEVGVIFLVADHWHSLPQVRHHVAVHLARFFQVVWLDNVPTKTGRRIDRQRGKGAAKDFSDAHVIVQKPSTGARWLRRFNVTRPILQKRGIQTAIATLRQRGCKQIVLYVWRPLFARAVEQISAELLIYHMDDDYSFTATEMAVSEDEAQLLRRADRVFAHSIGLMKRKGMLNENTVRIPNGVDFAAFTRATIEPADLREIPHPRIGYCGVLKEHLDIDLLNKLALAHPQWSFLLIGPVGNLGGKGVAFAELARLGNVYVLGRRTLDELPAYVQRFDVGLLCYDVNNYTNCIYPMKLHQYLAAGAPVISAPIRTAVEVASEIAIARTLEEWSQAIECALGPEARSDVARARRQAFAAAHDWPLLVGRVAHEICAALGSPYKEQSSDFLQPRWPSDI